MTVISKNKNLIKIYYSSKSSIGKKTLAYVEAATKDLLAIDIEQTKVPGTQWKELAEKLNTTIGGLINQKDFNISADNNQDASFSETAWIKILNNNPEVLTHPILLIGNDCHQITNPSDVAQLLDVKNQNIDEKKHI